MNAHSTHRQPIQTPEPDAFKRPEVCITLVNVQSFLLLGIAIAIGPSSQLNLRQIWFGSILAVVGSCVSGMQFGCGLRRRWPLQAICSEDESQWLLEVAVPGLLLLLWLAVLGWVLVDFGVK